MRKPLLIVMSAPSGAGKSTLCDQLLEDDLTIQYSISCTTRKTRGNEVDGEDYFFISHSDFQTKIDDGAFLEHAKVHGEMYGTLKSTVHDILSEGNSIIMDIDVQGAEQIRKYVAQAKPDDPIRCSHIDIFITVSSIQELKSRLIARDEDSQESIERRIAKAEDEMSCSDQYKYVIVNDDLTKAYKELQAAIGGF